MNADSALLEGELGFATVPSWLQKLDELSGGTIDLSRVTRVDSAGLALLLELSRRSATRGMSLSIRGANEQVLRLAGFFGLDRVLHFQ